MDLNHNNNDDDDHDDDKTFITRKMTTPMRKKMHRKKSKYHCTPPSGHGNWLDVDLDAVKEDIIKNVKSMLLKI